MFSEKTPRNKLSNYVLFLALETGSPYVVKSSLKLSVILQLQPPEHGIIGMCHRIGLTCGSYYKIQNLNHFVLIKA